LRQTRVHFTVSLPPKLIGWVKAYCSANEIKIAHFIHEALEIRLRDLTGNEQHPEFYGSLPPGRPRRGKERLLDVPFEELNQCMKDWLTDED
jgi:hypothetical protein